MQILNWQHISQEKKNPEDQIKIKYKQVGRMEIMDSNIIFMMPVKRCVAQWHILLSIIRRKRVRIPLPLTVVTIELSRK